MIEMPMPLTTATNEVDEIRSIVRRHIDSTGETITEIADRAELPRDFLYRFLAGSYKHSPRFEDIARLLAAVGFKMVTKKI